MAAISPLAARSARVIISSGTVRTLIKQLKCCYLKDSMIVIVNSSLVTKLTQISVSRAYFNVQLITICAVVILKCAV